MKKLSIVLFMMGLLTGAHLLGQSKRGSIQGVWRVVEVTMTGPEARTISQVEPNLTIITARHYSRIEVHSGPRSIPADMSKASSDELRAVWGPFVGEAGTYEVTDGNLITMRPIVAKNFAAMARGSFSTYSYKLAGDTMWVTAQRNQNGPVANPVTVKAVRAE